MLGTGDSCRLVATMKQIEPIRFEALDSAALVFLDCHFIRACQPWMSAYKSGKIFDEWV